MMRWSVLLVVVAMCVAGGTAAATGCSLADHYFSRHNISADVADLTGVCGGDCCGRRREAELSNLIQKQLMESTAALTRPVADLLLTAKSTLQEHLTALSHRSQNKTASLFARVYRGHATRAHAPIAALYDDVRALLRPSGDADDLGSPPPRDLEASARKFFRDVFPVTYHNVIRLDSKQFTPVYEACLRDAYEAVQPFGEVPRQVGTTLSRSLEATRALLQALALGASVLSASDEALSERRGEACTTGLLRAGACSRCRGYDARPCKNYCLNVMRGCVGSVVTELDAPWVSYVEGVERLARADADDALRVLDSRVSEAIMHALEKQVVLEEKVLHECGAPSTMEGPAMSSSAAGSRRDSLRAPPPDTELLQFAASLAASKLLFAKISERLCDNPDLADDRNDNCWTGEHVGQYTRTLVSSASVNDQRYNPEVAGGAAPLARISTLADKLRHAKQLLLAHSVGGSTPAAESFMQGDEAGEGSGSGRSYPDDDAAYDAEGSGEGSGDGRIREDGVESVQPKSTDDAAVSRPLALISLSVLAVLSRIVAEV